MLRYVEQTMKLESAHRLETLAAWLIFEGGWAISGQLSATATPRGNFGGVGTFLVTFWSKAKPPHTENSPGSKMNRYTTTLESGLFRSEIGSGPSKASFWRPNGFFVSGVTPHPKGAFPPTQFLPHHHPRPASPNTAAAENSGRRGRLTPGCKAPFICF